MADADQRAADSRKRILVHRRRGRLAGLLPGESVCERLRGCGPNAREVLEAFVRWPTWMWANVEVVGFAEWLLRTTTDLSASKKVGFYGLDVYSLWDSLYAVLGYLRKSDPSLLPAARRAIGCFQPYGEDVQQYARATALVPTSCEDEVIDLLQALRTKEPRYRADGREEFFTAEQNAVVEETPKPTTGQWFAAAPNPGIFAIGT